MNPPDDLIQHKLGAYLLKAKPVAKSQIGHMSFQYRAGWTRPSSCCGYLTLSFAGFLTLGKHLVLIL